MNHPDWCSQGHRCGLGEHRSEPLSTDTPRGTVVVTMVCAGSRRWLEWRWRQPLPADSGRAQARAWTAVAAIYRWLSR